MNPLILLIAISSAVGETSASQYGTLTRDLTGDPAFVIMIEDATQLDIQFNAMVNEINPGARGQTNLLASIKQPAVFGAWIDLQRPLAIACYLEQEKPTFVFAAYVEDFEDKIADAEFVTQDGSCWQIQADLRSGSPKFYCLHSGGLVTGSTASDWHKKPRCKPLADSLARGTKSTLTKPVAVYVNPYQLQTYLDDTVSAAGKHLRRLLGADKHTSIDRKILDSVVSSLLAGTKLQTPLLAGASFDRDGIQITVEMEQPHSAPRNEQQQRPANREMFANLPNDRYLIAAASRLPLVARTEESRPKTFETLLQQVATHATWIEWGITVSPQGYTSTCFISTDRPETVTAVTKAYLSATGATEKVAGPTGEAGQASRMAYQSTDSSSTTTVQLVEVSNGLYAVFNSGDGTFEPVNELESSTKYAQLRYVHAAKQSLSENAETLILIDLSPVVPILARALNMPMPDSPSDAPPISIALSRFDGRLGVELNVPSRTIAQFYSYPGTDD